MNTDSLISQLIEQYKIFRLSGQASSETTSAYRYCQIFIPIRDVSITYLLFNQIGGEKIYWKNREDTFETVGFQACELLTDHLTLEQIFSLIYAIDNPEVKFYGGIRFNQDSEISEPWQLFGKYSFVLPRFEIRRTEQHLKFICNLKFRSMSELDDNFEKTMQQLKKINLSPTIDSSIQPALIAREDLPNKFTWEQIINVVLTKFQANYFDKIVLARQSSFEYDHPIDARMIFLKLKRANPISFSFYFQFQQLIFLGCSPERLYKRNDKTMMTEALAGTRPRGKSFSEDLQLENELITSEKDIREHRFVVDYIYNHLVHLCENLTFEKKEKLLKLARLQHLQTQFSGDLKPGVFDQDILAALHPTPAVCGEPKEQSMQEINRLEGFDRGWYAGPVGWLSSHSAEFAVAIRSGLIEENKLRLFAGAGIVSGSDPEKEWQEIETKLMNFYHSIQMQML